MKPNFDHPIQENPSPSAYRITVFGPLTVYRQGELHYIPGGGKAGEILAFLAAHHPVTQSRTKIIDAIWHDSDVQSTRARFRQELSKLRSQFSDEGDDALGNLIQIDDQSVRLTPSTQVDLLEFNRLLGEMALEDLDEAGRNVGLALERYQKGELFLEFASPWSLALRARIATKLAVALRSYAEALIASQRISDARLVIEELRGVLPSENDLCDLLLTRCDQPEAVSRLSLPSTSVTKQEVVGGQDRPNQAQPPASEALFLALRPAMGPNLARILAAILTVLLAVTLTAGFRYSHRHNTASTVPTDPPVLRPKWTVSLAPLEGEVQNSCGQALCFTNNGIAVTGITDTVHDDTDIVTFELDRAGKLLWRKRYSSPEHDCDRSFSVCRAPQGAIYVGGETYVPEFNHHPGGWHTICLHYAVDGKFCGAIRFPERADNVGRRVTVAPDTTYGAYVGFTALDSGLRHQCVLYHVNDKGVVQWSRRINLPDHSGQIYFKHLAAARDGSVVVVCAKRLNANGGAIERWAAARYSEMGACLWTVSGIADSPAAGDSDIRVTIDGGDNILIGGAASVKPAEPLSGAMLHLFKLDRDGGPLWHRSLPDTSPTATLTSLSTDAVSNILVGGTLLQKDGRMESHAAVFDRTGNRLWASQVKPPVGYQSVKVVDARLAGAGEAHIACMVAPGDASTLNGSAQVQIRRLRSDSIVEGESMVALRKNDKTVTRASAMVVGEGRTIVTGQIGDVTRGMSLYVNEY